MKPSKMATAKRKKLLADAIILQPKRSRKRSEKWDNNEKNMVEDTDFLKRSVNVAARRYMNIINKHGFSDHSVIKLTSFFFGPETIFDDFRHFEKSCGNIALVDWLILLATLDGKGRKSRVRQTWRMPANLIADI